VRADGVFETTLGLVLVPGWLGANDFPDPVGTPLIVALGVALIGVGLALWLLAGTIALRPLAAANLVTAALAVVWGLAASGFSQAGAALTAATAAALTLLGAAQLRGAATRP
jgi:hypothetical protein